jgi:Domain of unknown function (DUF1854)
MNTQACVNMDGAFELFKNALGRWTLKCPSIALIGGVHGDVSAREREHEHEHEHEHEQEEDMQVIRSDQCVQENLQTAIYENVSVVRAFPIFAPTEGVSIVGSNAQELVWIESLDSLSTSQRGAVLQALQEREFMPEILRLMSVSSFTTPSTWTIQTNRGTTELLLKGEEDIRRLSVKTLIVSDSYGVQFLIKDLPSLDRHSRRLLDRFF